jgi:hypothetical protein
MTCATFTMKYMVDVAQVVKGGSGGLVIGPRCGGRVLGRSTLAHKIS